ncbi:hypothetical protein RR21198_1558 [Rhodococcus rhodochrous ATCC 21198]|uniref:hypothetical protein n=1 Tax=Rhodococcus aetherivorans TaxID=191292 RepID=UPI0003E1C3E3|nr:hypothetical protein [Rhodococcus aetherivorans]ETT27845.1 hypothetical protein RR21198_1558 [Rhodococcus rhodochrous ATCC 21198]NGP29955.1 hypothetical protein [Rhodococcus aetherivorans]
MHDDPLDLDQELELLTLPPEGKQALREVADTTVLLRAYLRHARHRAAWTIHHDATYRQLRDHYLDAINRAVQLGVSTGLLRRAAGL